MMAATPNNNTTNSNQQPVSTTPQSETPQASNSIPNLNAGPSISPPPNPSSPALQNTESEEEPLYVNASKLN